MIANDVRYNGQYCTCCIGEIARIDFNSISIRFQFDVDAKIKIKSTGTYAWCEWCYFVMVDADMC